MSRCRVHPRASARAYCTRESLVRLTSSSEGGFPVGCILSYRRRTIGGIARIRRREPSIIGVAASGGRDRTSTIVSARASSQITNALVDISQSIFNSSYRGFVRYDNGQVDVVGRNEARCERDAYSEVSGYYLVSSRGEKRTGYKSDLSIIAFCVITSFLQPGR